MFPVIQNPPLAASQLEWRPVQPDDAPSLQALVDKLSPSDRCYRFHGAVNELPETMLREMTCVDQRSHVAFVATEPGRSDLVVDARWVSDAGGQSAEFAVMVAPAWRRRGLASRGIFELRRAAADRGVRRLHGEVLADNLPMLSLMLHCGFRCTPSHESDELVLAESEVGVPMAMR